MKFDRKDIEAVAKARVSRAEGNKGTIWMGGGMVTLIAGIYLQGFNSMIGWVLVIGGFVGVIWYMSTLSKKQNAYKMKLVKEWVLENQQEQEEK